MVKGVLRTFLTLLQLPAYLRMSIFGFFVVVLLAAALDALLVFATPEIAIQVVDMLRSGKASTLSLFGFDISLGNPSVAGTAIVIGLLLIIALRWSVAALQVWISSEVGVILSIRVFDTAFADEWIIAGKVVDEVGIIANATSRINTFVGGVVFPILALCSSSLILMAVFASASISVTSEAWVPLTALIAAYLVIMLLLRKHLSTYGQKVVLAETSVFSDFRYVIPNWRNLILREGLASSRSRLLANIKEFRRSKMATSILSLSPRFLIEALVILGLAMFFASATQDSLPIYISSVASVLVVGQRSMPLLQQLYANWALLRSGLPSAEELMDALQVFRGMSQPFIWEDPRLDKPIRVMKTNIQINGVTFESRFGQRIRVSSGDFCPGDWVCIDGVSGAGKTTLILSILGFLTPVSGAITVDGRPLHDERRLELLSADWVSQQSVESDLPIGDWLADKLSWNIKNLWLSIRPWLKDLELDQILSNPDDLTVIGFNNLSGGQKQKIALLKSLIGDRSVLVLDEFSSALDSAAESRIVAAIRSRITDKLVFLVSHREQVKAMCNKRVLVEIK